MAQSGRIILIDDDPDFSASLGQLMMLEDLEIEVVQDPRPLLASLEPDFAGVILSDIKYRKMNADVLLDRLRSIRLTIPLVILSGPETLAAAEQLKRAGAFAVLSKPVQIDKMLATVKQALSINAPKTTPRPRPAAPMPPLGKSPEIAAIRHRILEIAARGANFMIFGEPGSGKEYVARCIASASNRAAGPFVSVDCSALSGGSAEKDLFGPTSDLHSTVRPDTYGYVDRALGGVLYLANIEALPLSAQKALAVLIKSRQALESAGLGERSLSFRLAGGSSADLEAMAESGAFSADLLALVAADRITIPSLRQRGGDSVILFGHFLNEEMAKLGLPEIDLSASLTHYVSNQPWTGNVSELRIAAKSFAEATKDAVDEATSRHCDPVRKSEPNAPD